MARVASAPPRYFRLLALTLMLALLISGCSTSPSAAADATPTLIPEPEVSEKPTYTVQRGSIDKYMEFPAHVVPVEQYDLFFRASGRVRNIYFKRGDVVKAGDVIADLENLTALESQRTSDDLALRRAQIALDVAKLNLAHLLETLPEWSKDYEYQKQLYEYQVELAQIEYDETNLRVTDLNTAISDAQIIAPIDGVILSMKIKEGKSIEAYQDALLLVDISELEIGAELEGAQMNDLSEGMPVTITLSSQPGQEYAGIIRSLPYPHGSGSEDEKQPVRITLDVDLEANNFENGIPVRVRVVLEHREDVLWLPRGALREFQSRSFVVIQDGDVQRRIDVELGLESTDRVEILSGVEEGQIMIGP